MLKHSNEENQLLIPLDDITITISEGDIVLVDKKDEGTGYDLKVLTEETNEAKEKVVSLIEKLKNIMPHSFDSDCGVSGFLNKTDSFTSSFYRNIMN